MASLQGLHKTVEVEVGKHRVARKRTNQLGKFHSHFVLKLGILATSKVIVDDHIAVESTLSEIKQTIDDLIGRHVVFDDRRGGFDGKDGDILKNQNSVLKPD